MKKALGLALAVLGPLLMLAGVWLDWDRRWLALGICILVLARYGAWLFKKAPLLLALGLALGLWAAAAQATAALRVYPVLVNLALLGVFAQTLVHTPSLVERLARLHQPDLPAHGVAYTRKVTLAWCLFFGGNGLAAAATGLWADEKLWALYNGAVAYALMGLFFAIEWLVRQRVMAAHQNRA